VVTVQLRRLGLVWARLRLEDQVGHLTGLRPVYQTKLLQLSFKQM